VRAAIANATDASGTNNQKIQPSPASA
jgi:hypothetical protein